MKINHESIEIVSMKVFDALKGVDEKITLLEGTLGILFAAEKTLKFLSEKGYDDSDIEFIRKFFQVEKEKENENE
jgi:hypothetical protein